MRHQSEIAAALTDEALGLADEPVVEEVAPVVDEAPVEEAVSETPTDDAGDITPDIDVDVVDEAPESVVDPEFAKLQARLEEKDRQIGRMGKELGEWRQAVQQQAQQPQQYVPQTIDDLDALTLANPDGALRVAMGNGEPGHEQVVDHVIATLHEAGQTRDAVRLQREYDSMVREAQMESHLAPLRPIASQHQVANGVTQFRSTLQGSPEEVALEEQLIRETLAAPIEQATPQLMHVHQLLASGDPQNITLGLSLARDISRANNSPRVQAEAVARTKRADASKRAAVTNAAGSNSAPVAEPAPTVEDDILAGLTRGLAQVRGNQRYWDVS